MPMRIALNIGGDVVSAPIPPAEAATQAEAAEAAGFPAVWTSHFMRGSDSMPIITLAGARTSTVELGIGIVPTYPRHPYTLAQEAATVQSIVGGRLTLGVGVSHRPLMEGLGLEFASPAAHMREYLEILGALLTDGSVDYDGRFYGRVKMGFSVAGSHPVSIVVGALGPKMLQVTGELSDGSITWLAGPRGIGDHIAPALSKAAEAAGRGAPRVIVGLPIALCDDVEAGRAAVDERFARYGGLQNYQQQFEREGVSSAGDVAVYGPEARIRTQLEALRDAGATELWAVPFPVGPDAAGSLARTTALLASLAPQI